MLDHHLWGWLPHSLVVLSKSPSMVLLHKSVIATDGLSSLLCTFSEQCELDLKMTLTLSWASNERTHVGEMVNPNVPFVGQGALQWDLFSIGRTFIIIKCFFQVVPRIDAGVLRVAHQQLGLQCRWGLGHMDSSSHDEQYGKCILTQNSHELPDFLPSSFPSCLPPALPPSFHILSIF